EDHAQGVKLRATCARPQTVPPSAEDGLAQDCSLRNSDIGPRPRSTNGAAGWSYSAPLPHPGALLSPCVPSSALLRAGNGLNGIKGDGPSVGTPLSCDRRGPATSTTARHS